ncbi:MAG: hypothetical protein ACE5LX_08455, partial [Nitrospinota bacterium]
MALEPKRALELHRRYGGKVSLRGKPIPQGEDFLLLTTPRWVGYVAQEIAHHPDQAYQYICRFIGIISDGSAVSGLGALGPLAAMPDLESKAWQLAEYVGMNSVPLALETFNLPEDIEGNVREIVEFVRKLRVTFTGFLIEGIGAPRGSMIAERLTREGIVALNGDAEGTAVVFLAALRVAASRLGFKLDEEKVGIIGLGTVGLGIAGLLSRTGVGNLWGT